MMEAPGHVHDHIQKSARGDVSYLFENRSRKLKAKGFRNSLNTQREVDGVETSQNEFSSKRN